jgi:hypothetical protein
MEDVEMRRGSLVLAAALAALSASGAERSAIQKERDAQREQLRLDVEKKRRAEERRLKEEADARAAAERAAINAEAERSLYADPAKHFFLRIRGKYRLVDGAPVPLRVISGTILQVVGARSILVSESTSDDTVAIAIPSTEGLVDGQGISAPVVEAGTVSYSTVLGAKRTVRSYVMHPGMSFEEYQKLRASGVDMSKLGAKP